MSRLWLVCALLAAPLSAAAEVAINVAEVHSLSGPSLNGGATLRIRDGVLVSVVAGDATAGAEEVVRVPEGVVTPGFVAPYTHLGLAEIGLEATTRHDAVEGYKLGPAFDAQSMINAASTAFAVTRVEGVTHAVTAPRPGNDPLAGWAAFLQLSDSRPLVTSRIAMTASLATEDFVGGSRAALLQRLDWGAGRSTRPSTRAASDRDLSQ